MWEFFSTSHTKIWRIAQVASTLQVSTGYTAGHNENRPFFSIINFNENSPRITTTKKRPQLRWIVVNDTGSEIKHLTRVAFQDFTIYDIIHNFKMLSGKK